jgi:putative flippase GtrA
MPMKQVELYKEINKRFHRKNKQVALSRSLINESLQLAPSSKVSIQLIRSIFVSIVALVFDFGLLIFFKEKLGINYLIAATMSFTVGVIVNYFLSIWWVFADHKLASRKVEFIIFVLVNVSGLALNLAIIAGIVQVLGSNYIVGKIVSTIAVFFWNFLIRKKILY